MAAGNYYWVDLNRAKAAIYYQRVLDNFPSGKYAPNCQWRVAWVAYLNRQPNTDDQLVAFLRRYPVSSNAPNALYWLPPHPDRTGNPPHPAAHFPTCARRLRDTLLGPPAAIRS